MADDPVDKPEDALPKPASDDDEEARPPAHDTGDSVGGDDDDDVPFDGGGEDDAEVDADDPPQSRWDADDPRRKNDQMAPPSEPCECYCLHCGRTFMSDRIWFQKVIGSKDGFDGFWMCPTPNCGGAGFTFDIFPTDPDHPANSGWTDSDDDDDEEEWDEDSDAFPMTADADVDAADKEYDPDESKYKQLDELYGDDDSDDDDLEGEEWKYGLQPGERPAASMSEEMRQQRDEEEKKFDMPDEHPRELDWTNREDPPPRPPRDPSDEFDDNDIPF